MTFFSRLKAGEKRSRRAHRSDQTINRLPKRMHLFSGEEGDSAGMDPSAAERKSWLESAAGPARCCAQTSSRASVANRACGRQFHVLPGIANFPFAIPPSPTLPPG